MTAYADTIQRIMNSDFEGLSEADRVKTVEEIKTVCSVAAAAAAFQPVPVVDLLTGRTPGELRERQQAEVARREHHDVVLAAVDGAVGLRAERDLTVLDVAAGRPFDDLPDR